MLKTFSPISKCATRCCFASSQPQKLVYKFTLSFFSEYQGDRLFNRCGGVSRSTTNGRSGPVSHTMHPAKVDTRQHNKKNRLAIFLAPLDKLSSFTSRPHPPSPIANSILCPDRTPISPLPNRSNPFPHNPLKKIPPFPPPPKSNSANPHPPIGTLNLALFVDLRAFVSSWL